MYVERITDTNNLLARIYAIDPDVILIDLKNPSRDVLTHMFQMSSAVKRPVAMFVNATAPRSKRRSMPGSRPVAAALTRP